MIIKWIPTGIILSLLLVSSGCTVIPGNGYVRPAPAYSVNVIRPLYPMPAPGYYWRAQPGYGWGWHHPRYGWHRHW